MHTFPRHFAFRIAHFALILCFAFCVSTFAFLSACSKSDDPNTLYIVSPHASDIRLEFSKAFSAWHKQKYGTEVTVKWPDHGGTSDIQRYLDQQYKSRPESCGYDLFFGGGSATFNGEIAAGHLETPANIDDILKQLPADNELVNFRGVDKEGKVQWVAGTMSNFGIAINKLRISELKLQTPAEWKDLARSEWFGQVSLADPSKSGSVRTCYLNMLQQYQWENGWPILAQMFANADAVKDGGSNPAEETDLGNTAAGVVIDFFARNHVAKLGTDIMGFIIPEGGAILDADPIAVLKGAPHRELAGHFVEFVTSPEGQKLWVFKPKTPGGPQFKSLGRLGIHADLYTDPSVKDSLFDPANPFTSSSKKINTKIKLPKEKMKPEETRDFVRETLEKSSDPAEQTLFRQYVLATYVPKFIGDIMKSCFVDNHAQLVAARRAIIQIPNVVRTLRQQADRVRGSDPKRAAELEAHAVELEARAPELAARLGALPLDHKGEPLTLIKIVDFIAVYDASENKEKTQTTIKDAWREESRKRYESIVKDAQ